LFWKKIVLREVANVKRGGEAGSTFENAVKPYIPD